MYYYQQWINGTSKNWKASAQLRALSFRQSSIRKYGKIFQLIHNWEIVNIQSIKRTQEIWPKNNPIKNDVQIQAMILNWIFSSDWKKLEKGSISVATPKMETKNIFDYILYLSLWLRSII